MGCGVTHSLAIMTLSVNTAGFPELFYRERYRSFPKLQSTPCGIGCAYNCCDPIITSMIVPRTVAEKDLPNTIITAGDNLRKDIEGNLNILIFLGFFVTPFFFPDCLVKGPDFGINKNFDEYIQVYVLFNCPRLTPEGLCSIYNQERFKLCGEFRGCPEYCIKDSTPESSFLVLSFNYWLMRRLIAVSISKSAEEAIDEWQRNEATGIRAFLHSRGVCTDAYLSERSDEE